MRGFLANHQAVFAKHHALFRITRLRQVRRLDRTKDRRRRVFRVKHESIALALEAVGYHRHRAKVTTLMLSGFRYIPPPSRGC